MLHQQRTADTGSCCSHNPEGNQHIGPAESGCRGRYVRRLCGLDGCSLKDGDIADTVEGDPADCSGIVSRDGVALDVAAGGAAGVGGNGGIAVRHGVAVHVGGIVGRLSGIVEKSYNNGDIYNGFNVVGGIVGYWYSGYLKNVFNTGNITVFNKNSATSQVGGIVGSVDLSGGNLTSGTNADLSISNAYNLGSLRSFKGLGNNEVGGIVGATYRYNNKTTSRLKISNAYTMGNMYVNGSGFIGDIVGVYESGTINKNPVDYDKVYYIRPQTDNGYIDLTSAPSNLRLQKKAKVINYKDLTDKSKWGDFSFSKQKDGKITEATDDNWRMSNGSLPILNAFLSGSHNYFS